MKKIIKDIIKKYKDQGFTFEKRKKHIIAFHEDTKKMVTIGSTPSDRRAYKNICKILDKAMVA